MQKTAVFLALVLSHGSAHAGPDLQAIGRISYGLVPKAGASICTGTLVAPDLVLTAGHCVANTKTGEKLRAGSIRFDAGWSNGSARATAWGAEVILAEDSAPGPITMRNDAALLRLSAPMPANIATLPLAVEMPLTRTRAQSRPGLFLIAYSRSAPDERSGLRPCPLIGAQPGVLVLGCDVVSGNSGGPLLSQGQDGPVIKGIMVARGGPNRAYATTIPAGLRAMLRAEN